MVEPSFKNNVTYKRSHSNKIQKSYVEHQYFVSNFGKTWSVNDAYSLCQLFKFSIDNLAIFRVNIKYGCFRVANGLIMAVVKSLVLD